MDDGDRRQCHDQAEVLLVKRSWASDDVDQAIELHDLLETPDGAPDPVAKKLRARLTGELERRLATTLNPLDSTRHALFSSFALDAQDAFTRRVCLLYYRGLTNLVEYQNAARGQLDVAIEAFLELERLVKVEGTRISALLGVNPDSLVILIAGACFYRYSERRKLLYGDPPADTQRKIRADLDRAIDASEPVAGHAGSSGQAEGLMILGSAYACRYDDDPRYGDSKTIDSAVALLREALRLAEVTANGREPAAVASLIAYRDRLADALLARNTLQDVDAAIALYMRNRDEMATIRVVTTAGWAASVATAYARRWLLTRGAADQDRARQAHAEAFAALEERYPSMAFDQAELWGGLTWQEGWWAEAGAAYRQATRVAHLAVRQQGSRADREWIIGKTRRVTARAALALVRAGALDDALVTLETGRAVLLTEMFDRRAIDYERLASLAGHQVADEYRCVTDDLTRLEARLLRTGPEGDSGITAAIEEARRRRALLRARMGSAARTILAATDGPPAMAELREAAGPATVVYLDATSEGGLALILRPQGAPVDAVELDDLPLAAAMELTATLGYAVEEGDFAICAGVCEELWLTAMGRLLPKLRDATEVVLIPGGALAALPWHAAKLPGRSSGYVLDELAISYMPNTRSLPVARAAWEGRPRQLRALAIEAPEPTSGAPLATANEIAAVQSCHGADFQVTRLPGTEATIGRLRDALTRYEVLHFAGHALADPNDPLASALVLVNDTRLTIRELLATGTGAARLAVLSACETARVEDTLSDEMVSFPTALVQCGFSGVVGSLWAAADRPASMLMRAFYEQWRGKRVTPREALRAAQQYTRDNRYASPLHWANFVYVGP